MFKEFKESKQKKLKEEASEGKLSTASLCQKAVKIQTASTKVVLKPYISPSYITKILFIIARIVQCPFFLVAALLGYNLQNVKFI